MSLCMSSCHQCSVVSFSISSRFCCENAVTFLYQNSFELPPFIYEFFIETNFLSSCRFSLEFLRLVALAFSLLISRMESEICEVEEGLQLLQLRYQLQRALVKIILFSKYPCGIEGSNLDLPSTTYRSFVSSLGFICNA
uniref:Uncharacterized protein n=1 Tax=Solanum lycopersicum TaxID=4081 RepID=A0A3Q7FH46_SOLLC